LRLLKTVLTSHQLSSHTDTHVLSVSAVWNRRKSVCAQRSYFNTCIQLAIIVAGSCL